jgi:hypothetical protein
MEKKRKTLLEIIDTSNEPNSLNLIIDKMIKKEKIMESKSNRGGARIGSGRKPVQDKKIQLTIFVNQSKIDKLGGRDELKKLIYQSIDNQCNN